MIMLTICNMNSGINLTKFNEKFFISIDFSYVKSSVLITLILIFLTIPHYLVCGSNEEVIFKEKNIKFIYYPPNKVSQNNFLHIKEEISKINTIVLHIQNYLEMLITLKIIPANFLTTIIYTNFPVTDFYNEKNTLVITELGWNQILQGINRVLKTNFENVNKYLIENLDSLSKCRVSYKFGKSFEDENKIDNLSQKVLELFPEEDFAIVNSENRGVVLLRSTYNNNKIIFVPFSDEFLPTVLLEESKKGYYNLIRPSPDGKYIAYCESGLLFVYDFSKKDSMCIMKFINSANINSCFVIGYEWANNSKYLLCFYIDKKYNKRDFFIYDVDKKNAFSLPDIIQGWNLEKDSLYPYAYWAPNGNYVILTNGYKVYLIDVVAKNLVSKPIKFNNQLVELVWNNKSTGFASLEVSGKYISKSEFNTKDYRNWTIRRWSIKDNGKNKVLEEDEKQYYSSSKFIKLAGFWSLDRILFLEGHIKFNHATANFVFDFKNKLLAKLTPTPADYKNEKGETIETGFVELPIKYCYLVKSIDSKHKNIYDCGLKGTNYLYLDQQTNFWFIGIGKSEELPKKTVYFNLMVSPYPFQEKNIMLYCDISEAKIESFLKIIRGYNLRKMEIDEEFSKVFFLSNSRGPINLWCSGIDAFCSACEQINVQNIKNLELQKFEDNVQELKIETNSDLGSNIKVQNDENQTKQNHKLPGMPLNIPDE